MLKAKKQEAKTMNSLKNKIDFAVVFSVRNANPNGDPLNGNRPRTTFDGIGELSDVCLKRKIRNRLMEKGKIEGNEVFVQSDDNRIDEYRSLKERADGELKAVKKDKKIYAEAACKKWIDVRAFGQVFAYKAADVKKKKGKEDISEDDEESGDDKSVSIGIRGPVTLHSAYSIDPVNVSSMQITKSVNGEGDGTKRGSDTMGMKHRVDYGTYLFYGSMNPQLAISTGFSDADAELIKHVLISLFENDASSARPEGSMEVNKVIWWNHNCKNGQYSSAKVHRSLTVEKNDGVSEAKSFCDYHINIGKLDELNPEIYEGI